MLIENGLKPAWVFDGKPPQFKGGEVDKDNFFPFIEDVFIKKAGKTLKI